MFKDEEYDGRNPDLIRQAREEGIFSYHVHVGDTSIEQARRRSGAVDDNDRYQKTHYLPRQ